MAFDANKPNGIVRPDNWFGISKFTQGDTSRTAWDGAHAVGDKLWENNMGPYQNRLDPDGLFHFNADARWNGALVSNRSIDGAISGTTAHGKHGAAVNELSWRARPDLAGPSFLQSIENEFDDKADALEMDLEDGKIDEAEYDRKLKDARIEAIKDHIAFTKTMEAGYLRQDILDRAGHSDIKHIEMALCA